MRAKRGSRLLSASAGCRRRTSLAFLLGAVERWNGGTVERWNGGTVERWNGGTERCGLGNCYNRHRDADPGQMNGGAVERWNGEQIPRFARDDKGTGSDDRGALPH